MKGTTEMLMFTEMASFRENDRAQFYSDLLTHLDETNRTIGVTGVKYSFHNLDLC